MSKGKIIYLEGTSSSGKTTLAKTIQERSSQPFIRLAGDTFWEVAPSNYANDGNVIEAATAKTILLFSNLGVNVIVDIVPMNLCGSMDLFLSALHECSVLYVCVTCPLDELRRREKERGDRSIGTAENQIKWIAPQAA